TALPGAARGLSPAGADPRGRAGVRPGGITRDTRRAAGAAGLKRSGRGAGRSGTAAGALGGAVVADPAHAGSTFAILTGGPARAARRRIGTDHAAQARTASTRTGGSVADAGSGLAAGALRTGRTGTAPALPRGRAPV